MNRSIKVERLYPLGDYKNVKFIEEINDIPQNVATNPEAMAKLHALLLASVDLLYYKYSLSYKEAAKFIDPKQPDTIEKAITYLVELTDNLHTDFENYFKNGDEIK